jgi:hypothetical protein
MKNNASPKVEPVCREFCGQRYVQCFLNVKCLSVLFISANKNRNRRGVRYWTGYAASYFIF